MMMMMMKSAFWTTHAHPVPGGTLPPLDRRHIEGFLRHGIRAGFYLPSWPTVENLVEDAEYVLSS